MEAIITIIDRLISLVRERKNNNRKAFEHFVEPIFLDMALVHEDYRSTFIEAENIFKTSSLTDSEVQAHLYEKKNELLHIREKLNQFIQALEEEQSKSGFLPNEIVIFLSHCKSYFQSSAGNSSSLNPQKGQTWYTTLVDIMTMVGTNEAFDRNTCIKWSILLLSDLDHKWALISRAYAEAKIAYVR